MRSIFLLAVFGVCSCSPMFGDEPVPGKQVEQVLKVGDGAISYLFYLTGLGMGGYGSWRLAADHPGRFATVVPICGGGDPKDADKLKELVIWAWHGAADPTVPVQKSIGIVQAIEKAGSSTIRLTTLEGVGHVSWQAAYASPDLYEWLDHQFAAKNRGR